MVAPDTSNPPAPGPAPGACAPPLPDSPDPLRVLVVDDEPEVTAALCATLERDGCEVVATTALADALAALDRGAFRLILSDLYLGETDLGFRLAAAAAERVPRIPVVLLTGRPSFDGAAEAMRSRVAAIIAKPIDPHALVTTCRRVVREHELQLWNEELEAQNRVLAEVLPRAIEVKDPTTSGHAERVVRYTDTLARRCGVSEQDRNWARLAALLHDVGKIGVPDHILTKPGALTAEEREVIQRHPAMGYEILEPLRRHEKVRRWVYQHHERWDGRGYPEGLAGEDVELPGRILILAEVYDALAERRTYKEAWTVDRIVALFRDQAGRQFDPELAHLVADGLERMGGRFFAAAPGMLF